MAEDNNDVKKTFDTYSQLPVFVMILDVDKNIIFLNHIAEDLFNDSDFQDDYIPIEPVDEFIQKLDETINTDRVSDIEISIPSKSGSYSYLAASISKIKYNKDADGILIIGSDMTHFHNLKAESDSLIEDLQISRETIVQDAYRALDLNDKLAESEEKLKQMNATKDKFFSIIAHDLRNPVSAFTELTNLLASKGEEMSSEERMEFTQDLNKSSKQMSALLDNLLQWARAQSGRIEFNPDIIYIDKLVENIFYLLKVTADKKRIKLINRVQPETVAIGDENMIHTVLRNLISNAIKFTNARGRVTISSEIIDKQVYIYIEDNGVGIREENLDTLFRPDVYNSTRGTNNEKGTGLGLLICKEFIETNGGSVWAESELGNGTKFTFTLKKVDNVELKQAEKNYFDTTYVDDIEEISAFYEESSKKLSVEISTKEMELLPRAIEELEYNFLKKCSELRETLLISEIQEFANELRATAEKYDIEVLSDYCAGLKENSDSFELDGILKDLNEFPKLIDKLKQMLMA